MEKSRWELGESGATEAFKHDEKKVLIMLALLNGEDAKDPLWENK